MSSSSKRIGPVKQLWFKWKALRLPWRRRFLVGLDLEGNTFWEFRISGVSRLQRPRRIVEYPRSTPYSEVRITPQWHQWLRYTRDHPPSLTEQRQDVVRQEQIKRLAAEADARWEAKPRVMEAPAEKPALETKRPESGAEDAAKPDKEDPWAAAKATGPGETWQPQTWTPTAKK